jgi:S-adenosylmethionine:tRNA ribosyltransferase-isomerase
MLIQDFNYELPEELIAQFPADKRENSRLLVVNRVRHSWKHDSFVNFPEYLTENDVLVLNNTKVFPVRLKGQKASTGGLIELFLIKETSDGIWETLAKPAKRLKNGTNLIFENGENKLTAEVIEKTDDGRCLVKFETESDFFTVLEKVGQIPLPPYIKRPTSPNENDRARYQTVYASQRGAIAAPTAGLHFTPEILAQIKSKGVEIVKITLHVGYGTFEPVRVSDLSEHKVAPEKGEISLSAANLLYEAKARGKRIIAVGTTTTRILESAAKAKGELISGCLTADLTITPGYKFRFVDGLLTNFHLPQSSLLVLVATFAGFDLTLKAYQQAVAERYRFYSYGDCMLIV